MIQADKEWTLECRSASRLAPYQIIRLSSPCWARVGLRLIGCVIGSVIRVAGPLNMLWPGEVWRVPCIRCDLLKYGGYLECTVATSGVAGFLEYTTLWPGTLNTLAWSLKYTTLWPGTLNTLAWSLEYTTL